MAVMPCKRASAACVKQGPGPGEKLDWFWDGWKPKLIGFEIWLGFSGSGPGASSERSLGRTGMPFGSRLSGFEDLGRATAPAADFGLSIALSLLQNQ